MKKHFVGFALFVAIVVLFATMFAFFEFGAKEFVVVDSLPVSSVDYCDLSRTEFKPTIVHAVADRKRSSVTVYLNELPRKSSRAGMRSESTASFTFYAVEGDKVRLIEVWKDWLVRNTSDDHSAQWILRYKADWIKKLGANENLYVVPRIPDTVGHSIDISAFPKEIAKPVLISND